MKMVAFKAQDLPEVQDILDGERCVMDHVVLGDDLYYIITEGPVGKLLKIEIKVGVDIDELRNNYRNKL